MSSTTSSRSASRASIPRLDGEQAAARDRLKQERGGGRDRDEKHELQRRQPDDQPEPERQDRDPPHDQPRRCPVGQPAGTPPALLEWPRHHEREQQDDEREGGRAHPATSSGIPAPHARNRSRSVDLVASSQNAASTAARSSRHSSGRVTPICSTARAYSSDSVMSDTVRSSVLRVTGTPARARRSSG